MDRTFPAYIDNDSNNLDGSSLYGIFKVVVGKPLNRQENIMKKDSNSELRYVYEVGGYCGIEGRLWSVLVEDNKNSLKNIMAASSRSGLIPFIFRLLSLVLSFR